MTENKKLKVALVCDWLTNVGGAEKVLLRLHRLYPEAPIYTSQYDKKKIDWFLDADVRTGWLQFFPKRLRRFLGPLRQIWFQNLKLEGYDVVISVTGAEAKAVKVIGGRHISYCHVPTQYYYQMYDKYLENPGFGILNPVVRFFFKLLVGPLRRADLKAAGRVDEFVTISKYAQGLIRKYYKREAVVVSPPVEVKEFRNDFKKSQAGELQFCHIIHTGPVRTSILGTHSRPFGQAYSPESRGIGHPFIRIMRQSRKLRVKTEPSDNISASQEDSLGDFYVVTSRQVTWKRLDLAVLACRELERNLIVIGEGPEHNNLVKMAEGADFIKFIPLLKKEELAGYLGRAKGYLFPSMEPFGIAPVEALAVSCPVVAFGEGGAVDYIKDGENGVFFQRQEVKSLEKAILRFEKIKFNKEIVKKTADRFSEERFDEEIRRVIQTTQTTRAGK